MDPNYTAEPQSTPAQEGDQSGADQASSSGFNWNVFFDTLGNTAVGVFGNNQSGPTSPSAPPMQFQSNRSNATLWIVLTVLVVAAVATIYLVKKK